MAANGERGSISIDDDMDAWLKAVKEEGMPWTQVCGANGKGYKKECMDLFGVSGVPSCVLIDKEGKIVARDLRGEKVKEAIEKAREGKL